MTQRDITDAILRVRTARDYLAKHPSVENAITLQFAERNHAILMRQCFKVVS